MINGRSLSSRSRRVGKHGPMRRNSSAQSIPFVTRTNGAPPCLIQFQLFAIFPSQEPSLPLHRFQKTNDSPSSVHSCHPLWVTTCATICIAYLGCRPGVDRSGSQVDRGVLALGPHAGLNFSRAKRNRLSQTRTHPVCALSDRGSLDFNPGQPPC